MAGLHVGIDIIGANLSGFEGGTAILPPFPDLGGTLISAYLLGNKYAQFCPNPIGRALGPRYDWSEHSYHLNRLGLNPFEDWGMECTTGTDNPTTPFSSGALEADETDGYTLVAFHYADPSAKAINLIRSVSNDGTTDAALALLPQTSSGTVLARSTLSSTPHSSSITNLADELGAFSLYAAHIRMTDRTVYCKAPEEDLRVGTTETTDVSLDRGDPFYMGRETGSGAGLNYMLAAAFYRGKPSDTAIGVTIPAYFSTFHQAIGSGLTLP